MRFMLMDITKHKNDYVDKATGDQKHGYRYYVKLPSGISVAVRPVFAGDHAKLNAVIPLEPVTTDTVDEKADA